MQSIAIQFTTQKCFSFHFYYFIFSNIESIGYSPIFFFSDLHLLFVYISPSNLLVSLCMCKIHSIVFYECVFDFNFFSMKSAKSIFIEKSLVVHNFHKWFRFYRTMHQWWLLFSYVFLVNFFFTIEYFRSNIELMFVMLTDSPTTNKTKDWTNKTYNFKYISDISK